MLGGKERVGQSTRCQGKYERQDEWEREVWVTKARWRGRAREGKEERIEGRGVERQLDGQDSKDATSQLRTNR